MLCEIRVAFEGAASAESKIDGERVKTRMEKRRTDNYLVNWTNVSVRRACHNWYHIASEWRALRGFRNKDHCRHQCSRNLAGIASRRGVFLHILNRTCTG